VDSQPEPPREHPNDPLHGLTLKVMLETLVERYGWVEMGEYIPIRCFQYDPSIQSSLKFLRRTEWARKKVESAYLDMLWEMEQGSESPDADAEKR